MVKLGIILTVNGIINSVVFLIIRKYINTHGGILEVGLFQAGYNLCNTYVGFVFTAIATDYFPSLSGVANSIKERNRLVCQQLEIGIFNYTSYNYFRDDIFTYCYNYIFIR